MALGAQQSAVGTHHSVMVIFSCHIQAAAVLMHTSSWQVPLHCLHFHFPRNYLSVLLSSFCSCRSPPVTPQVYSNKFLGPRAPAVNLWDLCVRVCALAVVVVPLNSVLHT